MDKQLQIGYVIEALRFIYKVESGKAHSRETYANLRVLIGQTPPDIVKAAQDALEAEWTS